MNQHSKLPLILLAVNFVFVLGLSFLVARSLHQNSQKTPLESWFIATVRSIASDLHSDWSAKREQKKALLASRDTEKQRTYAKELDFAFVMFLREKQIIPLMGEKALFPFTEDPFHRVGIGVHRNKDWLFVNYFMGKEDAVALSQRVSLQKLQERLSGLGLYLSILEKDRDRTSIIYSNFEENVSKALLQKTSFARSALDTTDALSQLPDVVRTLSLNNEHYLTLTLDLIYSDRFQQKITYALKIPGYEAVSLTDVYILIWCCFILCSLVNILIWRFLRKS